MSTPTEVQPAPLPGSMVTADELAKLLRVEASTVYWWKRQGLLPGAVRIGRTIRWPREAVDNLVNGRQTA
jgi:excisionase family DNA binding protein